MSAENSEDRASSRPGGAITLREIHETWKDLERVGGRAAAVMTGTRFGAMTLASYLEETERRGLVVEMALTEGIGLSTRSDVDRMVRRHVAGVSEEEVTSAVTTIEAVIEGRDAILLKRIEQFIESARRETSRRREDDDPRTSSP